MKEPFRRYESPTNYKRKPVWNEATHIPAPGVGLMTRKLTRKETSIARKEDDKKDTKIDELPTYFCLVHSGTGEVDVGGLTQSVII